MMRKKRWWITFFIWITCAMPIIMAARGDQGQADKCGDDEHYDPGTGICRPCKDLCKSQLQKHLVICKGEPKCEAFWPVTPQIAQQVTTPAQQVTTPAPTPPTPTYHFSKEVSSSVPPSPPAQDAISPFSVASLVLVAIVALLAVLYLMRKKKWHAVKRLKSIAACAGFRQTTEEPEDPEVTRPLQQISVDQQAAVRSNESLPSDDAKHPIQVVAQHSEAETSLVTSHTVTRAPERIEDTQVKSVIEPGV